MYWTVFIIPIQYMCILCLFLLSRAIRGKGWKRGVAQLELITSSLNGLYPACCFFFSLSILFLSTEHPHSIMCVQFPFKRAAAIKAKIRAFSQYTWLLKKKNSISNIYIFMKLIPMTSRALKWPDDASSIFSNCQDINIPVQSPHKLWHKNNNSRAVEVVLIIATAFSYIHQL